MKFLSLAPVPIALMLLAGTDAALAAAGNRTQVAVFKPAAAQFPSVCHQTVLGMSGICLLASTAPKPKNQFLISPANPAGRPAASAQPVPFNRFLRLDPGEYLLYSRSGLDTLHEMKVTVYPGISTPVQTGTLRFNTGKVAQLRHYQPVNGIDGRGCTAEVIGGGNRAVLPGNYQVALVAKSAPPPTPLCVNSGTTFNVLAGQVLNASARSVVDQAIKPANTFTHPNGVSSLASISRFMADVERLSLLTHWKSFRGIHSPHGKVYDALVLSGIGTRQFVVPFTWRGRKRECGLSLAEAGLPSHVLLTACVFKGKRLTSFRVNPGSYYTLNNRHGKTAIEGNYINNPIVVRGVRFETQ